MPAYVNTQQIDAQVLAALQAEGENVTKGLASAPAKESPQKDLFDMSTCCMHRQCYSDQSLVSHSLTYVIKCTRWVYDRSRTGMTLYYGLL